MNVPGYDNWKLSTPPDDQQCETCGEWLKEFEIVTPAGHTSGYVLCPDCAREMREQLKEKELLIYTP